MSYFSIIIPSFNRAHILTRAVEGVLMQTFQDFEILIIDDGSTDNTKAILDEFLYDERIKYIYQTNAGVCYARNTGAKLAKGKYLIFLDSDDAVEICWLQDFYDLAMQNKDLLFCSLKIVKQDLSESFISASNPYNAKKDNGKGSSIAGSWAINKEVFHKVGMYDTNIKFGENVELGFRFDAEKINTGIVDNCNFIYFESLSGGSRNLNNKIDSNLYIINKHISMLKKNSKLLMLYYQNIAVAYAKLKNWKSSSSFFWKAYMVNVKNYKLLLSFFISLFPIFAKRVWK